MNGWLWYCTDKLAVVPYMPGTPVYRDNTLPFLYMQTKNEEKLPLVFQEDGFNLGKFVAFFEKRQTMQVLCHVDKDKNLLPVGYSWVDSPAGVDGARGALCGFCFLKEAKSTARDLGRLGIAYWMEDLRIDILHGVILEYNSAALNYARRLGFKEVAYVPKWRYVDGRLTGVRVVQLEKEDFWDGFEKWYQSQNPVEIPARLS